METTEIKVELEDSEEEVVMTKMREDQPLALIKRRERDITERFPYIDEVTTTTITTPGKCEDLLETEELADTPDDTVTSSVDKGEGRQEACAALLNK